jgi:hypothetical protein
LLRRRGEESAWMLTCAFTSPAGVECQFLSHGDVADGGL